jgi:hypothetical protein
MQREQVASVVRPGMLLGVLHTISVEMRRNPPQDTSEQPEVFLERLVDIKSDCISVLTKMSRSNKD